MGIALNGLVKLNVGVVGRVAGELDFEVAVEGGRVDSGLGNAEADLDDGELCAAGGGHLDPDTVIDSVRLEQ